MMLLAGCGSAPRQVGAPLMIETRRTAWQSPFAAGEQIDTRHYRIYSTISNPRSLLGSVPGFMEAAHDNYLRLTGLADRALSGPLHVYMVGTRAEWVALTQKATGPLADKYAQIEAGGYCHNGVCVFWDIGPMATLSVASHEGLHQFFYHRLKQRLPAWLEEGLCATAEGYELQGQDAVRFTPDRNVARFNNLRQAIVAGRWIDLKDLLVMDSGDITGRSTEEAVGYYGQLWALAAFIRSRGDFHAGMFRLLADAEAGRFDKALKLTPAAMTALMGRPKLYNQALSEPLFRHYISGDLESFDREFQAFAKRLARL